MLRQYCIAAVVGLALTGSASAAATFTASSPDGRSAQAVFDRVDNQLVIRLSNTSAGDTTKPRDVLTAVYFDTAQPVSLTYVSTTVADGSAVVNGPGSSNITSQWAFNDKKKVQKKTGARYGVGAAALGMFKGVGNFDYGLASLGNDPETGNKGFRKKALVQSEVVITFSGLSEGFDPDTDITQVIFQFGKKASDRLMGELADSVNGAADSAHQEPVSGGAVSGPASDPVAAPAPLALLGGLALLGCVGLRRRAQGSL
jgi:hypothetical protein